MSNYKVPNVQLREAYNRTLKEANFRGPTPLNKTDSKKAYVDNAVKVASKEEAREIFDSHLQEIDGVVNPKFKVVYSLLHQPGEHIIESCVCGVVLECLRFWYKEAIRWNSIAEGPVSNIPDDFKDIYLKVYDSGGNLILSDEYTLESKGLKKTGWTRLSENIPEN